MLNKDIETGSNPALQSFINIQKMHACCQKGCRPNKREDNPKFYKVEKAKPVDNQLTILVGITSQASNKNPQKTRGNY